jgi:hypothetical protein
VTVFVCSERVAILECLGAELYNEKTIPWSRWRSWENCWHGRSTRSALPNGRNGLMPASDSGDYFGMAPIDYLLAILLKALVCVIEPFRE